MVKKNSDEFLPILFTKLFGKDLVGRHLHQCLLAAACNRFAMLAAKMLAGAASGVNVRKCVTHAPPSSANKAAHSGFETQRIHCPKPKTGLSVATQRGLMPSKIWQSIVYSRTLLQYLKINIGRKGNTIHGHAYGKRLLNDHNLIKYKTKNSYSCFRVQLTCFVPLCYYYFL